MTIMYLSVFVYICVRLIIRHIDMKQVIWILATLCALICTAGCIKDKVEGADLKVGDRLPGFSVVMNDGSLVTDESLRGSVSCVMFFHTSCPDCQRTLPEMQRVYGDYVSKGVLFALISREQGPDLIDPYWSEQGYDMPYSAQSDRTVYNKFATSRIPRVYICDKDGIIRYIYTDDPTPTYENLSDSVKSLLFRR